ncbi:hypothetical protein L2E82_35791 [Cichorium intybus]|uniref:Uncharacterized protein n=1 Tax=Cichorium intybus TaxID=13427 RepID=A0ACB9BPV9_CICIN|nr:hypothetical protein L2E82_35791 [Cichorium intybus]
MCTASTTTARTTTLLSLSQHFHHSTSTTDYKHKNTIFNTIKAMVVFVVVGGVTMMNEVGIEGFATHLEKLLKTRLNLMFEMLENFQLIFRYMKFPNWDGVSYLCVWEKRKVEVVLFMAILWLLYAVTVHVLLLCENSYCMSVIPLDQIPLGFCGKDELEYETCGLQK